MLNFFRTASDHFYGTGTTPGLFAAQQHLAENAPASEFGVPLSQNPLLTKQAIIVLREELEYFAIPPKDGRASTDASGIANEPLLDIKRQCGQVLLEKRNIFTALQRNVNKENNMAEQHLIDMLCMRYVVINDLNRSTREVRCTSDDCRRASAYPNYGRLTLGLSGYGRLTDFSFYDACCSWILVANVVIIISGFDREDTWGFRALEPSRCCISSIALVLLKTGIIHNGPPYQSEPAVTVDYNQMATAQKLLLFWRKPAVRLFYV